VQWDELDFLYGIGGGLILAFFAGVSAESAVLFWFVWIAGFLAFGALPAWWRGRDRRSPPARPVAQRNGVFTRTVFTHPGMCNESVGVEGEWRVCHVTMTTRGSHIRPDGVTYLTEVTNVRTGKSDWHGGRYPMADCLEWASEHSDEVHHSST
jgi:hypothetical protein